MEQVRRKETYVRRLCATLRTLRIYQDLDIPKPSATEKFGHTIAVRGNRPSEHLF